MYTYAHMHLAVAPPNHHGLNVSLSLEGKGALHHRYIGPPGLIILAGMDGYFCGTYYYTTPAAPSPMLTYNFVIQMRKSCGVKKVTVGPCVVCVAQKRHPD